MGLGDKIRELREARGWSQDQLAQRVGISQAAIVKIETGQTAKSRFLPDIAKALDRPIEELVSVKSPFRFGFKPPPKSVGEQELPVYASVEAGPGEMIISTDQPIDVVPRPWFMGTVTDGYAVLVVGESMVPAFEPGDYAIINPHLPVMRNKDVILTGGEEEGEFRATIKRLVSWTPDDWMLRQFNPPDGEPRDFRRPKRDWPKAVRVVGRWIGS